MGGNYFCCLETNFISSMSFVTWIQPLQSLIHKTEELQLFSYGKIRTVGRLPGIMIKAAEYLGLHFGL